MRLITSSWATGTSGSNPALATKGETRYERIGGKLTKHERLEQRKQQLGSRHKRKLKKFSDNFNKMFEFFYKINRSGLITFCGQNVEVHYDPNGEDGKTVFRQFEDGQYNKGQKIITRHPHVVKCVIMGKKGWGLWKDQWSQGIAEGTFTKYEILNEFDMRKIVIPESMLKEFEDFIWKQRIKMGT
jgi:hypothetical protein